MTGNSGNAVSNVSPPLFAARLTRSPVARHCTFIGEALDSIMNYDIEHRPVNDGSGEEE